MLTEICFNLNGKDISLDTQPLKRLIDVLRENLNLTGAKEGCGEGECGACAVLLDGRLVNSCLVPVGIVQGLRVVTIEGYRETERFRVLSECFEKAGGVQCGFCSPGMVLAAEALLQRNPQPSEVEIRGALAGNLCRCTGYSMIVEAVLLAAEKGEGLW